MMQRGREHACLHKPCLAYWLPVKLQWSCSMAHYKTLCCIMQLPGGMCLTVLEKRAFCVLCMRETEESFFLHAAIL